MSEGRFPNFWRKDPARFFSKKIELRILPCKWALNWRKHTNRIRHQNQILSAKTEKPKKNWQNIRKTINQKGRRPARALPLFFGSCFSQSQFFTTGCKKVNGNIFYPKFQMSFSGLYSWAWNQRSSKISTRSLYSAFLSTVVSMKIL